MKPLHHAHTPAVEPQASLASLKAGPKLAISPEAMAELKAGSKDYSHFHNHLKTITESVFLQQTTSRLELLAALEALPPSGLPEAPCGRQVPKDPQGKGQSGKSSSEGKQSYKGTTSSSALSSGSSGVGGGSDAGGDGGGDRDPPKHTGHHDDVEPDRKEEEEEESDSDDEPRPEPQNEQKLSGDSSAAEGESNQEQRERNDSGTNSSHQSLPLTVTLQ